jgi:hypothetical protein
MRRAVLAVLFTLGLVAPLAAQTYSLAPPPYQTVFNNNGDKVSNACVWTYSAGTTTPIATYSDASGTTNPNPIRTDTAGRFTAYLVPGTGYKFVYELPCTPPGHGVVLKTADNVAGTPSASVVTTGTWIPSLGGTTTYATREGFYVRVGALVFVTGNFTLTTIGTGSVSLISGLPFPAATFAAGSVQDYSNLSAAVVSLGVYVQPGGTTLVLDGQAAATTATVVAPVLGNNTAMVFSLTYSTLAP